MIFAHDQKQYDRWRSAFDEGRGLTGAALERAIAGLAGSHPDLVTVVN